MDVRAGGHVGDVGRLPSLRILIFTGFSGEGRECGPVWGEGRLTDGEDARCQGREGSVGAWGFQAASSKAQASTKPRWMSCWAVPPRSKLSKRRSAFCR